MRSTALLLLIGLLMPAAASAGLVEPGQTVTLSAYDLATPAGTLIDEGVSAFSLNYGVADPANGFDGSLNGVLNSKVYRTPGGTLTFMYDVDLNPMGVSGAAERSTFTVESFVGLKTWVTGAMDFESLIEGGVSADGAMVTLRSDTPGLGGSPTLVIETDATAYDAKGMATYAAGDEVMGSFVSDETMIDGVFAPSASIAPPPAVIPLPPAVYSGMGVLLALVLIAATRRVWATI